MTLTGCTTLWTDDFFYCSLLNNKEIDEVEAVSEPNGMSIYLKKYKQESESIEIITPGGIVGTK